MLKKQKIEKHIYIYMHKYRNILSEMFEFHSGSLSLRGSTIWGRGHKLEMLHKLICTQAKLSRPPQDAADGTNFPFRHGASNFGHLHCFYTAVIVLGFDLAGADCFSAIAGHPTARLDCDVSVLCVCVSWLFLMCLFY